MSFRKRNVGLTPGAARDRDATAAITQPAPKSVIANAPGIRPSPVDGRSTTSTGIESLDDLLAGHAGLPMGTTLLVGENGTTDYAGALLRFYAAEGAVQGHHVHVVGFPEAWGRELPGLVEGGQRAPKPQSADEKMKIAWRYERQNHLLAERSGRRGPENNASQTAGAEGASTRVFCHTFDLTKRLAHPGTSTMTFHPLIMSNSTSSPFSALLQAVSTRIALSEATDIHRIVIPSLLSPAIYPSQAARPEYILQFFHGLRALIASFPDRITAMTSLPLSIYPRSTGLTRWLELLSDGVIELSPFPHSAGTETADSNKPGHDEQPQGLLTVHRLPVLHERGGGSGVVSEESTFTLSRKRFTIKLFNLPPLEGDTEAQQERTKKADMDF